MKPAQTPQPPYYAVVFTSLRTSGDQGYGAMSDAMVALAAQQPGYLGMEAARDPSSGLGITVSYWRSQEEIAAWHKHAEHKVAQERGRGQWYEQFEVRVCKVERAYRFARQHGERDAREPAAPRAQHE